MLERRYAKTANAVRGAVREKRGKASVASNSSEGMYKQWYGKKPCEIEAYLGRHPNLLRKGPLGLAKKNPTLFRVLKERGLLDKLGYLFDQYSLN